MSPRVYLGFALWRRICAVILALCLNALWSVPLIAAVAAPHAGAMKCCQRNKTHSCCKKNSTQGAAFTAPRECGTRCPQSTSTSGSALVSLLSPAISTDALWLASPIAILYLSRPTGAGHEIELHQRPPPRS